MDSVGLAEARRRTNEVDAALAELVGRLPPSAGAVAAVALDAYGRGELTPRAEVDVLFLHDGALSRQLATQLVYYPLWERHVRLEPRVRTLAECATDARKSLAVATSLLDARLVGGDRSLFEALLRRTVQPLRRDRAQLRQRLRPEIERRHASHAPVTSSSAPDIVAGRGGLLDVATLGWLEPAEDPRLERARDLLLATQASLEAYSGPTPHRLGRTHHDRVAQALGLAQPSELLTALHAHARWVAFRLGNALAARRPDRRLGPHLLLQRGQLTGERLPTLERMPSLGLRAAVLAGYAPPDDGLLAWASAPGPPLDWDPATTEQFWLLLRAADWRAFEFLDVTGLLGRYLPEFARLQQQVGADSQTLDTHAFAALRRLHALSDTGDPFIERIWRALRHRDWLYLAVLLHELDAASAARVAERIGLPADTAQAIGFLAVEHRLLWQTASQRDLHDEDLLLELAARIGSPARLRLLLLVSLAHALALDERAWADWQAALVRQLFSRLDALLRQPGELGSRRRRSVDQHRQHLAAELQRQGLGELVPVVARLPRRYVLAHSPAFVARHLRLLASGPLRDGEVRLHAQPHRARATWDLLIVARDRPGLLATFAGVLALRGASVLAADAATCSDGLVLDAFTVTSAYGLPLERALWPHVEADLQAALDGRLPLEDLLGAPPAGADDAQAVHVHVDNAASHFFSLVEVRAPDQVGLLYRIASALHALGLDIHHAKIATYTEGALDVFYVWDLAGAKLDQAAAARVTSVLTRRLSGRGAAAVPG